VGPFGRSARPRVFASVGMAARRMQIAFLGEVGQNHLV
jgi:hypothetical protein